MGQKITIKPNDQSWVGKKIRKHFWAAGGHVVVDHVGKDYVVTRWRDMSPQADSLSWNWELYEEPEEESQGHKCNGSCTKLEDKLYGYDYKDRVNIHYLSEINYLRTKNQDLKIELDKTKKELKETKESKFLDIYALQSLVDKYRTTENQQLDKISSLQREVANLVSYVAQCKIALHFYADANNYFSPVGTRDASKIDEDLGRKAKAVLKS